VGINSFTDGRRFSDDLARLLGITTVVRDPTVSRDTANMQVEVQVTLADGRTLRAVCAKPPGSWGVAIDPRQHEAKIRDCLGVRLDGAALDRTLVLLADLETAPPAAISELMVLLAV